MATKKASRLKIIADASSLILLAKSGLLEQVLSKCAVIVAERVYEEAVVKGKAKGQADAFQLETHFQAKRLHKIWASVIFWLTTKRRLMPVKLWGCALPPRWMCW